MPLADTMHDALERVQALVKTNAGLLLIIVAELFFASMFTAVKVLEREVPAMSTLALVAVRMVVTYLCCLAYMLVARVPKPFLGPKDVRFLLLARGFCGFFSLFGIYYGLQYLSLSDAVVIEFLAPLCTLVAGAMFLKEKMRRTEILAGLLSLLGVVLIARPTAIFGQKDSVAGGSSPAQRTLAVGVLLFAVIAMAGEYITLRAISTRAHTVHCITAFASICVLVSCAVMLVQRSPIIIPLSPSSFALLLLIGVSGMCGQTFLTLGMQRETAGRGSLALYSLDRLVLGVVPNLLSLIGTAIILSCALFVAVTKPSEHSEKTAENTGTSPFDEAAALEEGLLEDHREDAESTSDSAHSDSNDSDGTDIEEDAKDKAFYSEN